MADRTGRTRYILNSWPRDPQGKWLERPPPAGKRVENIIWGHTVNDFFWIERQAGAGVITMWSRSMIREYGENYKNLPHDFEPNPRKLRPWPLLKLPPGIVCENGVQLGLIDEGCRRNHTVPPVAIDDLDDDDLDDVGKSSSEPAVEDVQHRYRFLTTPKLEEHIPAEFFPDILLVSDADHTTDGQASEYRAYYDANIEQRAVILEKAKSVPPLKYKRLWPTFPRDNEPVTSPPRTAHLDVSSAKLLGEGNHSYVHRANLKLPDPLSARSPSHTVTVAAKVAINRKSARDLLENEALMYNLIPQKLQEAWCGLNLCTPVKYPVPAGAVIPKFYGYYVPVRDAEWEAEAEKRWTAEEAAAAAAGGNEHDDPDESDTDPPLPTFDRGERLNACFQALSPILLLEECGDPVEPEDFCKDDRSECISLMYRLHFSGFLQQSFHTRNILMQPGPLTAPPDARSLETPSFRVIDLGRAINFARMKEQALAEAGLDQLKVDSDLFSLVDEDNPPRTPEALEKLIKVAQDRMKKQQKEAQKVIDEVQRKWHHMLDEEVWAAQRELKLDVSEM